MAKKVYTQRYAQAVFEIALETKELDRWQSDLRKIASLAEDDTLVAFLESPKIQFDDKAKLLSEQLKDVNPLVLNLVYLLATRGILRSLGDISNDYQQLLDNYHGIEVALKTEVEPGLIGGVIAKISGKLLDGSTRSKLEALRKEMVRAGR